MDRRSFSKGLLATVTSYALIDSVFAVNAFSGHISPIAKHWSIMVHEYCSDLKKNTITPLEWQNLVDQLFNKVELNELLNFIDFKTLRKGFQYPDLGVVTKPIVFPKLNGLPEKTVFVKKIFGMKKDRAVIPHGHSNMVSSHLVLKGEMHLRHYEKIKKEGESLIIKPSVDRIISAGDSSSISDEKDNIHWFIANTDKAFTFDVIVLDLNEKPTEIQNIDIYENQNLGNGIMKVPILDVDTALKKYGKLTHH